MSIMNSVKGGADLTHPKVSSSYIIGAVIAVIVLFAVFAIGGYLYRKGKSVVTGGTVTAGNQLGMSGVFGDGT